MQLQDESDSQVERKMSTESSVNKVMETIMANVNEPSTQDAISNETYEDRLMELFNQFSGLTLSKSDWLESDTTIVTSETCLQGKSTTYQIKIQNLKITALLDTGASIWVVLEKFFKSLHQTPQLFKVCKHKDISPGGANLGPVGQCDLTFRLGNKRFTDGIIVLQYLHRSIILGLNC